MRKFIPAGIAMLGLLTTIWLGPPGRSVGGAVSAFNPVNIESEIVRLTNVERTRLGLSELVDVAGLNDCARQHSEEMVKLDYFDHVSPTLGLQQPYLRVKAVGLKSALVGENIYDCEGYPLAEIPELAVRAWMESPDHRANMVGANYVSLGVGVFQQNRQVTITQVFTGAQ